MGGFCQPPIWILMGLAWSLRRLHFNIPWNAKTKNWFGRMVVFMGRVPRLSMMGGTHIWMNGCGWRTIIWWATCKYMTLASRRLGYVGYSWRSLAIMGHIRFPRVCGWKELGRILSSLGRKECGCIMMIWSFFFTASVVWWGIKVIFFFGGLGESKGIFSLTLGMMLQE